MSGQKRWADLVDTDSEPDTLTEGKARVHHSGSCKAKGLKEGTEGVGRRPKGREKVRDGKDCLCKSYPYLIGKSGLIFSNPFVPHVGIYSTHVFTRAGDLPPAVGRMPACVLQGLTTDLGRAMTDTHRAVPRVKMHFDSTTGYSYMTAILFSASSCCPRAIFVAYALGRPDQLLGDFHPGVVEVCTASTKLPKAFAAMDVAVQLRWVFGGRVLFAPFHSHSPYEGPFCPDKKVVHHGKRSKNALVKSDLRAVVTHRDSSV